MTEAEQSCALDALCSAAQLMLENGAETYRVEETARRMATGFRLTGVSVAALPTLIFVEAEGRTRILRISRRGTNMTRIERTNDISRRVEHGGMTAQEAGRALEQVARAPGAPQRTLLLASAVTSASFSLLFGGGPGTFAVAFLIGLAVQAVQPLFARIEMGVLFGNFAGGFITAVLAQLLAALFAYGDVNAAIVGGIMPLLSGLLMTTAMRDTMYGDLISGVTRAVEALLLAGAVALGVYVGLTVVSMMGGVLL